MTERKWSEYSGGQRRGILLSGAAQVALLVAALADIWRRPQEGIRGNKRVLALVSFVNFVGPIAYFAFGRRR